MAFWDDNRGQAIQIGAVLLFAVLVIAFSLYQAFVVPNQNEQVEANHLQTVAGDMQDLRNAIVSVPQTGEGRSVGIALGTSYPARLVALNPPPPSGRLHTLGTDDNGVNWTVANARATDDETDDYWTGTNQTRDSGAIVYAPNYNEFTDPPTIGYDMTALFRQFNDASLWTSGQRLVDGRKITLVAIEGSYDRASSQSTSVDLEALSASQTDVPITNETGENVTVQFASMRNASDWRSLLRDSEQFVDQGGYVVSVDGSPLPDKSFDLVTIEFKQSETYTLRMAKVGVGTNTESESARYITDIAGDGESMQEESKQSLIVEARDRFNNPVSGVELSASVESGPQNGSLANSTVVTDAKGRAEFQYLADDITGQASRSIRINVSLDGEPTSAFDPKGPKNVSMTVTVQNTDRSGLGGGGGGGNDAYTTSWKDPSGQSAINCPGGVDNVCTFDASQRSTATLTMSTSPIAQQAPVEFALNDTSVLSLSRTTGTTNTVGENSTKAQALDDGFVNVYTTSGSSGDTLVLKIINAVSLIYNNDAVAVDGGDSPSPDKTGGVKFSVTNEYSSDVTIDSITIDPVNNNIVELSDALGNYPPGPENIEIYIAADTDAFTDYGGGVTIPSGGLTTAVGEDGNYNSGNKAVINAGNSATISFYEFYATSGNSGKVKNHDMSGEPLNVTITYTVNGIQATEEFTLTAQ